MKKEKIINKKTLDLIAIVEKIYLREGMGLLQYNEGKITTTESKDVEYFMQLSCGSCNIAYYSIVGKEDFKDINRTFRECLINYLMFTNFDITSE